MECRVHMGRHAMKYSKYLHSSKCGLSNQYCLKVKIITNDGNFLFLEIFLEGVDRIALTMHVSTLHEAVAHTNL